MGVSKNHGTPQSSILIGFSIINHPFWGTNIFGNIHIFLVKGYKRIQHVSGVQKLAGAMSLKSKGTPSMPY